MRLRDVYVSDKGRRSVTKCVVADALPYLYDHEIPHKVLLLNSDILSAMRRALFWCTSAAGVRVALLFTSCCEM